jgi:hypothetical protein
MSLFLKAPRPPRRFSYEPRYYDPRRDEDLRHRMRHARPAHPRRRHPARLLALVVLLALAAYLYLGL